MAWIAPLPAALRKTQSWCYYRTLELRNGTDDALLEPSRRRHLAACKTLGTRTKRPVVEGVVVEEWFDAGELEPS